MTENERIAAMLRATGFFYRRNDAGKLVSMGDEEILKKTEGTLFRARAELRIALEDTCAEIKELSERPLIRATNALLRFICWIKGGNHGDGN